jgi:hypothetical protein
MPRLKTLSLLAVLGLLLAGCGNKQDVHTLGETEGIYVDVAELSYQVQLSRILNPSDVEDQDFLKGLPPGTKPPGRGETWFAIFMRVSNPTTETHKPASSFRIVDTLEREYEPVPLDPDSNPFVYQPSPIRPGQIIPDPNSISGEGDIQGSLILFKVSLESLQNRPLELKIDSPLPPPLRTSATVDLDV